MSYSDEVRRQRIVDDQTLHMNGPEAQTHTIGGKMQADSMRANQQSFDTPFFSSTPTNSSPTFSSPNLFDPVAPGRRRGVAPTAVPRKSAPLFPSVDKAFDRVPGWLYVVLMVLGALGGLGASSHSSGTAALTNAFMGAFVGLILIPALKTGVKVVLAALAIGLTGLIIYLMFQAAK